MYLKSLEIQGFKSFPEKTCLLFDKPITAIVGPNGSGKSNISDALLWVMGEQSSRTLRGGKMEDVVFGGTQRRTQLGFAEVSLVIDNSEAKLALDTTEVMITRRYYRSGESEYYINRSSVRLKDVHELLMDTGLGREGYSIIGQGRIAEILSTKSKDRREIFEEAAGISRYRHRKEESERKLGQAEENLVRIGDKIAELELQVEPLRLQAEVAKKFLLFRDELRGLEISVWLHQLTALQGKAEEAEKNHAIAKLTLDAASGELDNDYSQIETSSDKMRRCDIDSEAVREMISSAETQQADLSSEVAVLKSQLEGNVVQIERLDQELKSGDEQQDGVAEQIKSREDRLDEIKNEQSTINDKSQALFAELDSISGLAGGFADELSKMLVNEQELQNQISDCKSELSALASQAQELFDRENGVKLEIAEAGEFINQRKSEHENCLKEVEKLRDEVTSIGNVVNGLTLKAEGRIKKAAEAGENHERLLNQLNNLKSRHLMLSEMEKDFQGYSKAVKLIMQESARGVIKNTHGTVASLLKTSGKFAVAIETALGGAMQNIIVDSEDDGKAAITYLKRRDGGRATFLPLTTIKGNVLNESQVGNDDGFEGVAFDLIDFDPKYRGVYESLLGRVVIADDLNSAIRIAKKHGQRFKIVTLDGQVINAGGSMTGGSIATHSGIISRANEISKLKEMIESFAEQLKQAEAVLAECNRAKNAAEYELSTARDELTQARESLIRLESDEKLSSQLLTAANEALAALKTEIDSVNERIKLNSDDTITVRAKIEQLISEVERLKKSIEEATLGQERLTEERERVNEALSNLRADTASLDAEKDALEKAVLELGVLRDEMTDSHNRQLETARELNQRNEEIRAAIIDKERLSSTVEHKITEHKNHLTELNDKKLEIEAERVRLNKAVQDKNKEILDLERECSRLEQNKLAAQMEEKQILDNLWDTYELSRTAAATAGAPIESLAAAGRTISTLKRQIKELGSPNIGAIDEFERVNTRYTFLTTQRDDVQKAKTEILVIIDGITAQMRDIFVREFAIINESFEKTFKDLFGGGKASLILEDADDVLACGIDIQVQPPGKSLKTLTLLSGGEKAFVAIAIYFAILKVRPPPFVVMDEIEAALDDANVMRFAEHLRRMSNNSQMVVITHKRVTMEEADVLFGVTMQEHGVSSILKIDLEEAEKHISKA